MKKLDGKNLAPGASIRQVAFASFIGTAIEWYDFYLYGTAAALVFPKLFFPQFSPLAGTLASFATFGVATLWGVLKYRPDDYATNRRAFAKLPR